MTLDISTLEWWLENSRNGAEIILDENLEVLSRHDDNAAIVWDALLKEQSTRRVSLQRDMSGRLVITMCREAKGHNRPAPQPNL